MRERPQFGSLLRMLQRQTIPNSWILRVPPKQREKMLASAEGASGKILEHSMWVFAEVAMCTTALAKSAQNKYSQSASGHVLTSTWFLARASQVNRKRCSRAPKARAEKMLRHSMRGLCKCALSRHCAWQTMLKTQYFENAPKSLIHESMGFARASRTK